MLKIASQWNLKVNIGSNDWQQALLAAVVLLPVGDVYMRLKGVACSTLLLQFPRKAQSYRGIIFNLCSHCILGCQSCSSDLFLPISWLILLISQKVDDYLFLCAVLRHKLWWTFQLLPVSSSPSGLYGMLLYVIYVWFYVMTVNGMGSVANFEMDSAPAANPYTICSNAYLP